MYNVTNEFKTAIDSLSRSIRAKATIGEIVEDTLTNQVTYTDDGTLQSIEIERGSQSDTAFLGNTISKKYIIKIIDTTRSLSFDAKRVIPYIGVTLSDNSVEYVPFSPADVFSAEFDTVSRVWTITCYDDMQKFNNLQIKSLPVQNYEGESSVTFRTYATAVCSLVGLGFSDKPFYHDSFVLTESPNLGGEETLREVIGSLAEACFCNAVINRDGELEFVSGINTSPVSKTIDGELYFDYDKGVQYGPVNALVLSRAPQEDNVYKKDDSSIAVNGETSVRIENNPFLDYGITDKRYDVIEDMFSTVQDFS